MAKLVFALDEVQARLDHALAATKHRKAFGQTKEEAALFLVHDDGVYLMSSGIPMEERPDKKGSAIVVYAMGCNPDKDPDHWETSRALVGGDDFSESLPAANIKLAIDHARATGKPFTIAVTKTKIALDLPKVPVAADARWLTKRLARKTMAVDSAYMERGVLVFDFDPKQLDSPQGVAWRQKVAMAHPTLRLLNKLPIAEAVRLYNEAFDAKDAAKKG